jgi:hypothetical protein
MTGTKKIKVKLCDSLDVAHKVLQQINKIGIQTLRPYALPNLRCYSNGREQGYTMTFLMHGGPETYYHISWAENRSSDDVVVYAGTGFNGYGSPSEEAYEKAYYFNGKNRAHLAARHICALIEKVLN